MRDFVKIKALAFIVFHPGMSLFVKLFYLMCSCDSSVTFREGETSLIFCSPIKMGKL